VSDATDRFLASAIGSVRRIALQIVELPATHRPMAFNVVELNFNEVANAAGWESVRVAKFVELQMGALRALVREIETAGGAAGGHA
jgi:hypothetical protein